MSRGLIPPDLVSQIRDRADIVEIISQFVALSKSGQNLKGLCPFHSEKTPSFSVSPSRQIFHCFGCGESGNVFTFLMKVEGTTFPDTVRELGRRLGITVPDVAAGQAPSVSAARDRLEQIHQRAAAWFQHNLWRTEAGGAALQYLADRGITRETAERFGLGLSLSSWDGLTRALISEGCSVSDLAASGLVVAKEQGGRRATEAGSYYDRFRGRLMFPITDLRKRVVAFGGRMLGDGEPKYLNSPETALFSKGRMLYGLDRAREIGAREGRLIVVEGYFDAIALHQAGVTNVVATLGTALTADHLAVLRRFAKKVVLLFDPDPAGVRAALRCLDLFVDSGLGVTVVSLPGGHDPDTFVRQHGVQAFVKLQDEAPSLLEFAVEHALQRTVSGTIDDRIRSVDEILRILQKTNHRIEKEEYMRVVAERLGVSQPRLIERYPELLPASHPARNPAKGPAGGRQQSRAPEEWDLAYLLIQGQLSVAQLQALRPDAFVEPVCRRIVELGLSHRDRDGRVAIQAMLDAGLADPACGSAVAELSMLERHFDDMLAHVDGCLGVLERKRREQRLSELIIRLRAAEQHGRMDEARQLNAEVNALRLSKAGSMPVQTS